MACIHSLMRDTVISPKGLELGRIHAKARAQNVKGPALALGRASSYDLGCSHLETERGMIADRGDTLRDGGIMASLNLPCTALSDPR